MSDSTAEAIGVIIALVGKNLVYILGIGISLGLNSITSTIESVMHPMLINANTTLSDSGATLTITDNHIMVNGIVLTDILQITLLTLSLVMIIINIVKEVRGKKKD